MKFKKIWEVKSDLIHYLDIGMRRKGQVTADSGFLAGDNHQLEWRIGHRSCLFRSPLYP